MFAWSVDGGRRAATIYSITTATLLDEAGGRHQELQDLLGHHDVSVTQTHIKIGNDTRKKREP